MPASGMTIDVADDQPVRNVRSGLDIEEEESHGSGVTTNPFEQGHSKEEDRQLKTEQQQWIANDRKAQPALDLACAELRKAGLLASSVTTQFSDPVREQNTVSEETLERARMNRCRTVVVERLSLPWLRRLAAGKDLAEKLVQQGSGFTLWIVE